MKLESFLAAKSVVSLAFGLAFIALPSPATSLLGMELDGNGEILGRMLGACLAGIGLACWFLRRAEPQAKADLSFSLCLTDTTGFVIALLAQLGGQLSELGWVIVALWGVFGFGLGYYRFLKPNASV